ncbi:MAG: alpha-amylase family protein, partial [Chloroflexota bacterium]
KRPRDLRALDQKRLNNPDWYQESEMVGYICYTDRFAQTLNGVAEKIDYLNELGVTYLHLMPLLEPRPEPNDGGYAVMNYRQVDSKLGSIDDLADLAQKLRSQGISLCTDLVCNHTAIEHEWARKARAGNPKYQAYYLTYTNRKLPDQYEAHLREIFPENAPGNFIFDEEMGRWVWSTFNTYQWDLNYRNPAVFIEMLDIILNLANHGVEIVRLDAVAFMWKELGTSSENLPEAHAILQAFRAFSRMAAPGLIFKAEAIVAPDDVVPYLGTGKMAGKECEIAYHNSLMVYMWSMLAEQNVVLSTYSLQQLPIMPTEAAWVNYVRLHDDIGWAIMDEYAAEVGLNGFMHRSFLSDFYAGSFPGTHAKGDIFQYNPETGDRRVCGSCASLAGLETALDGADAHAIDLAVKRILLIHSMIFAAGGIPLIYMGDELGMTNDYSYLDDPTRMDDSRWMQRPIMNWKKAAQRHNQRLPEGRIFAGMRHISEVRKSLNALHSNAASEPIWTHNDQIFGLIRESARGRVLVLGNFSDQLQLINAVRMQEIGFAINLIDHLTGKHVAGWQNFVLEPFESLWLEQR